MAIDRTKFNGLLNNIASVNFTKADNVAYPARKACAVCPASTSGFGFSRPANLGVVATGAPCPNPVRRWNASASVPMTATGMSHYAICFTNPGPTGSIPTPTLTITLASDFAPLPPAVAAFGVKVGPIGSMF